MKRTVAFSFLMACSGVLLGDSPNPEPWSRKPATLLEDLVRLTKAGSSDVTVLAYAKAHRLELPPEVSDSDLRWLRDSGVSELVVTVIVGLPVPLARVLVRKVTLTLVLLAASTKELGTLPAPRPIVGRVFRALWMLPCSVVALVL